MALAACTLQCIVDFGTFRESRHVDEAFSILDKDGSGVVETSEMSKTYDVSQNPAVKSGKA